MKDRYTVLLTGTTSGASRTVSYTFSYDLRRLVPPEKKASRFLLKSSFSTENVGNTNLGGIEVYVQLPTYRNKSSPELNLVNIGVAQPSICRFQTGSNAEFKYKYSEIECTPCMIEYPDVYQIAVNLVAQDATNIPDLTYFSLSLAFEEV